MGEAFTRTAQVRADSTDEPGSFEAVLFTGGEASDGHILDIRGASLPDSIPMFVNHMPDPTEQLGTFYPRREGDVIVARGEIFMEGEGAAADIRRDVAAKIAAGHVGQVSGRWDANPDDVVARTSLPKDHPAHVGSKATGAKRYGSLFRKWRAMEGSVVGLGADPSAVMRFARDHDAPEAVREFWTAQARDGIDARLDALDERLRALEITEDDSPTVDAQPTEGNAAHEADGQGDAFARAFERFEAQLQESQERALARIDEMLAKATGKVQ